MDFRQCLLWDPAERDPRALSSGNSGISLSASFRAQGFPQPNPWGIVHQIQEPHSGSLRASPRFGGDPDGDFGAAVSQFFLQKMGPEPERGNMSVNRSPHPTGRAFSGEKPWFPEPPSLAATLGDSSAPEFLSHSRTSPLFA